MTARHRWPSVADCRLERAIGRALRTLPLLRYKGECLVCCRPESDVCADDCARALLAAALTLARGTIAPKEVDYLSKRTVRAKKASAC